MQTSKRWSKSLWMIHFLWWKRKKEISELEESFRYVSWLMTTWSEDDRKGLTGSQTHVLSLQNLDGPKSRSVTNNHRCIFKINQSLHRLNTWSTNRGSVTQMTRQWRVTAKKLQRKSQITEQVDGKTKTCAYSFK